ncbi:outer membrane beta-barrel protein [Chitinophaga sp. S165]|uniref:outer membrane beta-barrel protein n=1 Tax=Chitinophaga sp. S165 TaxID=2135462 RepID=UPI000D7117AA|nr:outer membrane beta-barrel protein [Chitinophaga sp. S165]PWV53365.1 outer membrane protein with beta-barrel domain [Chitinophaga sp. S165]
MRVVPLFLCCMLMACTVIAQRNYVPGVIITLQNDSLKGFIDFRNWYQAPTEIVFKESLSDKTEQHFKPADIKGFKVAEPEVEYVSRKVSIDITKQSLTKLTEVFPTIVQDTPVFLMRMVTGRYNLYEYIDVHSREHYIYDAQDVPATELVYTERYIDRPSGGGIFKDEKYKYQLADLFADNKALAAKAAKVAYREANLTKLFLDYNNYKGQGAQNTVTVQKKNRQPVAYGIMGGLAFNSYPFSGPAFLGQADYENSKEPIGGIWVDIPIGRSGRNFSFVAELLYKKVDAKGKGIASPASKYHLAFGYLQLNMMVRYTYPTKGLVKPYINAGMGNGLLIKTIANSMGSETNPRELVDGPRKYEQTAMAGIGVKVRKINVETRYTTGNGFSPYSGSKTPVRSLQVLAGYSF